MTVHTGSRARSEIVPSAGDGLRATRDELLVAGVLSPDGDALVLRSDYTSASHPVRWSSSSQEGREARRRVGVRLTAGNSLSFLGDSNMSDN